MKNLQEIKSNKQSKYDEIIEYLKQDNCYWLECDEWDCKEKMPIENINNRYFRFYYFENIKLRNEVKYYILHAYKEDILTKEYIGYLSTGFKHFSEFLNKKYKAINSFSELNFESFKVGFRTYVLGKNIQFRTQFKNLCTIIKFFKEFYDFRIGFEKDIWKPSDMQNVKLPASRKTGITLNFEDISFEYRECVKRYIKYILTRFAFTTAEQKLATLKYFFNYFEKINYKETFLENFSRKDWENYIFYISKLNLSVKTKHTRIAGIVHFLEYIQNSEYKNAPIKNVKKIILESDIPKQETFEVIAKRMKFVPQPILQQIDKNIHLLDRENFIPVYILLRESGWRTTDILNLRYDNCLEKVWNKQENTYNYYLVAEITKTHIKEHKIPIREKVAEMLITLIDEVKNKSIEGYNPYKYLFNTFSGKRKGEPFLGQSFKATINRLCKKYEILDAEGSVYHFAPHSLRHTRAVEYVEQGMSISIIQQILGHHSLQMTIHYANVSENILYKKWKDTEDLELFKVDIKSNEIIEIFENEDVSESLIRYEYIKKNLDAVRVPFGVCFKSSKIPCKQQMNHCLNCASFCTTTENIPEYEEEIEKVKSQIQISKRCGRDVWAEKNEMYLDTLEKMLTKVKEQKIVHKNGKSREEQ
ncbi:MAG: tyrosine-type recombinase/integrase [Romboutsia sp.]|uniref:tyrosine-type recombinase/integrase n=1 Tax=Romboutsia sp. TaxID=1965302 RepID=UPI003F419CB2